MANASLALGVSCAAVLPPANCDGNDPVWVATIRGPLLKLTVANPHSPSTTAALTANFSLLDPLELSESSLGFRAFQVCEIKPSNVPLGLHLTGQPYVNVNFSIPPPGGDRTANNKPSLEAYPPSLGISRGGSTNAISFPFQFVYKGPADSVTFITKSGSNPDRFQVFGPPTPFGVSKTVHFTVNVVFVGVPAKDINTYSVDITVLTDNLLVGVGTLKSVP